jgi:predicted RNA-binding Zn-ribbon protein involved in translation (DUF1610 family)
MVDDEDNDEEETYEPLEEVSYARCFRCGAECYNFEDGGSRRCPDCGEHGVYTIMEAYDMLNDLFIKKCFTIRGKRDH